MNKSVSMAMVMLLVLGMLAGRTAMANGQKSSSKSHHGAGHGHSGHHGHSNHGHSNHGHSSHHQPHHQPHQHNSHGHHSSHGPHHSLPHQVLHHGHFWHNTVPVRTHHPAVIVQPMIRAAAHTPPQNVLPSVVVESIRPPVGTITLSNPAENGGAMTYALNGTAFTMLPGHSQTFENDRVWVIRFGSGGSRGNVSYTLSPGVFQFSPAVTGWDLARVSEGRTAAQLPPPAPQPSGPLLAP